jgi:site-specific recombinase XerD
MHTYEKHKFATNYAKYERLLILQGYSKATISSYTRGIRQLSEWCDKYPD